MEGLANLIGCTWRTAKQRLDGRVEPCTTVGQRVYYDTRDCLPIMLQIEQTSLEAERIRKTQADADLTKTRNDQLRGQLVAREEVLQSLGIRMALIRDLIEQSSISQSDKAAILDAIVEGEKQFDNTYEPLDE